MSRASSIAVLHLDESCLGNGREGATPGGAGGLIEVRTRSGVQRRDFFLASPDTTNNRMALSGAIAAVATMVVTLPVPPRGTPRTELCRERCR